MQFQCERCDKSFTCKRNLLCHLQKQFKCYPKSQDSPTTTELYEKLTTRTVNVVNYPCKYCAMMFNSKSAMYKHSRKCKTHNRNDTNEPTSSNVLDTPTKAMQNKETSIQQDSTNDVKSSTVTVHNNDIIKKLEKENDILRMKLVKLQAKKNEDFYQDILEKHFNATHKKLPIGITDITTEDTHIEIKRWSCWREAFAQLILYNSHDPKEKLHACFFGEYTQPAKDLAISSLKQQNITCFELTQTPDAIYMTNLEDNAQEVVWTIEGHTKSC